MKQLRRQRHEGPRKRQIKAGALYRCRLPDGTVETALVRSVSEDPAGIPHVRFDLVKDKPHMLRRRVGPRILSLSAFQERYREIVSLPDAQAAE